MAKKKDFDYFDLYARQAQFALEMVLNLRSGAEAGELGTKELMDALLTMEKDADEINHLILEHLAADFVVPLERSSMSMLAHHLDDVSDAVDDVAINAYVHMSQEYYPEVQSMLDLMVEAAQNLAEAMQLFPQFKRNIEKIRNYLIQVHTLETSGDDLYIASVRGLFEDPSLSFEERFLRQSIMDSLEEAMDALENAAESVQTIISESL